MQNRNKRTEQNLCESTPYSPMWHDSTLRNLKQRDLRALNYVCIALQYTTCNVKESIKTHSLACSWVWFTPTVEPGGKQSRTPLSTWAVDSLVTLDRIAKALGYCFVAAQRGFKSVELMSMRCMDAWNPRWIGWNRRSFIGSISGIANSAWLRSPQANLLALPPVIRTAGFEEFRRRWFRRYWVNECPSVQLVSSKPVEPGFAGLLCAQKQFLTAWEVKEMLEMLLVQRCALVTSSFADLHGFHCQSFARSQEISCL